MKPLSQNAMGVVEVRAVLAYTGKVVGMVRLDKILDISEGCWMGRSVREE